MLVAKDASKLRFKTEDTNMEVTRVENPRNIDLSSGTARMVLGVVLTFAVFFSGWLVNPIADHFGWDGMLLRPIIRSIAAIACIILLGGKSWLRFDWRAIRNAWHFVLPLIMINLILAAFLSFGFIVNVLLGEPVGPEILLNLLEVTVLCLFVGINEEGMFRGLMFGGLLAGLGKKRNGVLIAALISSAAFGFIHVVFDLSFDNPLGIVQGLLKTLECGMFGFVLCVTVLENKNYWGAMSVHSLFDWVLMAVSVLNGSPVEPSYVSTNPSESIAGIVVFIVLSALYTPKTIAAYKRLKTIEEPQYGPFMPQASAPISGITQYTDDPYVREPGDVDAKVIKLRDHKVLNHKVLTIVGSFASFMLLSNVLSILPAVLLEGTAQQLVCSVVTIITAFVLLLGYTAQFKGEFDGVLNWSTAGLLLALPISIIAFNNVLGFFSPDVSINPLLFSLIMALAPGISEEIVFRAIPASNWMRVSGKEGDIIPAMLVTSAVFGLVHAMNILAGAAVSMTAFQVFYAFCLGVPLCAVFLRSGSIWPSIIMHTFVDFTAFLIMEMESNGVLSQELTFGVSFWLMVVVSVLMIAWGMYLVRPAKQAEIVSLWNRKWHKN